MLEAPSLRLYPVGNIPRSTDVASFMASVATVFSSIFLSAAVVIVRVFLDG